MVGHCLSALSVVSAGRTFHVAALAAQVVLLRTRFKSYSGFSILLFWASWFCEALFPVAFANSLAISGTFMLWGYVLDPSLRTCIQERHGFGPVAFVVGDVVMHHAPAALLLVRAMIGRGVANQSQNQMERFAGLHSLATNIMWGALVTGFDIGPYYCSLPPSRWRALWITTAAFHLLAGELFLTF